MGCIEIALVMTQSKQDIESGTRMANDKPLYRVLYVVNSADFFLSHRLALAMAARGDGYEVHVATPLGAGVDQIRDEGLAFHEIKMSRSGVSPGREALTILGLYKLYKRLRPDLVHHVTIKPVIYGGIAARLASVPAALFAVTGVGHVFTDHGLRSRVLKYLLQPAYKLGFRHPNCRVIFQNRENADNFVESGLVDPRRADIIRGSGVDTSEFSPTPYPDSLPVILLAARMIWSKGIGEFVEAAKIVNREDRVARFILVGDTDQGNPAGIKAEQLMEWNETGVVEWWGRRDDMPYVMSQSSIVCLPTSYGEGVPKVLIEAAACGRPIIATDVPGCRDIVREGVNGLLVKPGDVPSLVAAIRELLADPARGRDFGKNGRDIAVSDFALEIVIGKTLALYREILAP